MQIPTGRVSLGHIALGTPPGGQFSSSTELIKPIYQHHSFPWTLTLAYRTGGQVLVTILMKIISAILNFYSSWINDDGLLNMNLPQQDACTADQVIPCTLIHLQFACNKGITLYCKDISQ